MATSRMGAFSQRAVAGMTGPVARRMVICIFTGFASGLPLFFLIQLIPAWLFASGVDLKDIGLIGLANLPYSIKFLWAPLLDRFVLVPGLGRRRSWMLVMQLALIVTFIALGYQQPDRDLFMVGVLAMLVGLFSATLDIALDAYRRELLPDAELGMGNAIHVQAYRIAGLVPGALALILADFLPWPLVFTIVAAALVPGVLLALVVREPDVPIPRTFLDAVVRPFLDFFLRSGIGRALLVLAFLFFYKLGDTMATALSTPFYQSMGFTLSEIGIVAKNAALWPAIIGSILGGLLMMRIGINRALWLFGVVQVVSILGFAVLAQAGPDLWVLAGVISFEYLGVGLGTAAFVAFIARESNPTMAAMQIALLTALTAVARTFAGALSGFLVEGGDPAAVEGFSGGLLSALQALGLPQDGLGWTRFFYMCTVLAVPGMVLLLWVAPFGPDPAPVTGAPGRQGDATAGSSHGD